MFLQLGNWVARGELDNRQRDRVTGRIWFAGQREPMRVDLEGNCLRDLAGCLFEFENPGAESLLFPVAETDQAGQTGEITATRRVLVKDPNCASGSSMRRMFYLEWFNNDGFRVLIEGAGFSIRVKETNWQMTIAEEERQRRANGEALQDFNDSTVWVEDAEDEEPDEDPDGELAIERMLRLTDLRHEVDKLGGRDGSSDDGLDMPPALEENFLQNLLFFENAPQMKRRDVLGLDGFQPRTPDDVPEEEIEDALWALIFALARRRNFLENTDHLSDRQLYELLWEQILEEPTSVFPESCRWSCEISVCDYGSPNGDNGLMTFLRFYADDHFRLEWEEEFPDQPLPRHRDPPYSRDELLPTADPVEVEDEYDDTGEEE